MITPESGFDPDEKAVCELVLLALDKRLDERQRRQFNDLLRSSEAMRKHYLECLAVQVGMKRLTHQALVNGLSQTDPTSFDPMLWKALAEDERTAEPAEIVPASRRQPQPLIEKVHHQKVTRRISKLPLAVAIASLAALLMMIAYVLLNPRPYEKAIAVITDTMGAQWTHTDSPPRIGQTLYNTTYDLYLASGVVKLKYESGAEVLVEGPAVFSCETADSMRLTRGKAYSKLSPMATGFTVMTPSCRVIDLGTQFGVCVKTDGSSTVQLHQGKASLIGGYMGQSLQTKMLNLYDALHVDAATGAVNDVPFNPLAFIRHIDSECKFVWNGSPFDLADAVGGGNGFGTGQSGAGINPENGRFNAKYIRYGRAYIAKEAFWSSVAVNPFVDCVFIPDGSAGPQKVTSQTLRFDQFPPTDRRFHHDIFYAASASAMLPLEVEPEDVESAATAQPAEILLVGVRFGVKERPAILMHAPAGITFDLAAIGQNLPGLAIRRFQSTVGIPDIGREKASLDVFVLLDGVCVFRQDHYTVAEPSLMLDIPLSPENRFLTLAVTDGGDGAWWDLCVFGEPYLELGAL
jgi:hypothetical protein